MLFSICSVAFISIRQEANPCRVPQGGRAVADWSCRGRHESEGSWADGSCVPSDSRCQKATAQVARVRQCSGARWTSGVCWSVPVQAHCAQVEP